MEYNKIRSEIEKKIYKYLDDVDVYNEGVIFSLGDGIAQVHGLKSVMYGELLKFPNNVDGMVFNLKEFKVGVILMGKYDSLKEGDKVRSTGKILKIGVDNDMLGRVVDPLGNPLDGKSKINFKNYYNIEKEAPSLISREKVSFSLNTGIKIIDGLIPIGKGQRELIVGDRHTGKSAVALDTIINQKNKNVIAIYVIIGQQKNKVAKIFSNLKKRGAMDYSIIVSATADFSASMQYLAPYSATAIAEYFCDQGKDVLIVYDDLSKHAIAYREISLLLERSPGREAYPGDVFYLHSRLLERSAMLSTDIGGSITALPIVETQNNDISAYIPTNIISITDGQIYFESSLFRSNIKPAINIGLSVSRIGGDAQSLGMKQVASKLKLEYAHYKEIAHFKKFYSNVDKKSDDLIKRGERIVEILKQDIANSYTISQQILIFFLLINGYFDEIKIEEIKHFEEKLIKFFEKKKIIDSLKDGIDEKKSKKIIKVFEEFNEEYQKSRF